MRFALGSLISATVLFIAAGVGAVGSWALPVAAVLLLVSTVVAATALEDRNVFLSRDRWSSDATGGLFGLAQTLRRTD